MDNLPVGPWGAQPILASQGTLDEGVALIEKPFSRPQLLAKVRDVLEG